MNQKTSNKMNKSALAVMLAFGLTATHLEAASMGRINVLSALGQPLKAELELNADAQELAQMKVRLAPPSVFKQAEVPYTRVLSSLQFSLDQKGGKPIVRISSDKPVHDPFLDFLVEITWANGSMVREYTFLLDPPDNTVRNSALSTKFPEPKEFVNPPVTTAPPPPVAPVTSPSVVTPAEEPRVQASALNQTQLPAFTDAPTAAPSVATAPTEAPASKISGETKTTEKSTSSVKKTEKPVKVSKKIRDDKTYAVKKGDTLGAIAAEHLPNDVSLDQMLVSLFKNNPNAFINQNINRLKSGAILTIPDGEDSLPSATEAQKTVKAHTRDWLAYRQKLAAATEKLAAKPSNKGSQSSQGSINTLQAETTTPQATNQDQLKVSRSDVATRKPGVSEEDLIAKDKALREAESRVASLEKNISELQKLIEMKNQSLATLQQQADTHTPSPTSAPTVSQPAPDSAPAKELSVKPITPLVPDEKEPTPSPLVTESTPPSSAPSPTATPVAAPEEDDPEPPSLLGKVATLFDTIISTPLYYGSFAGLILTILGVMGWKAARRRLQQEAADDASFTTLDLGEEAVTNTETEPSWNQTDSPAAKETSTEVPAEVDPVAEADVYLSYGREAQAEALLKEALTSSPQRIAIHNRLLDIYARRESVAEFQEVAQLLYEVTNGTGEEWEKATTQARMLGITSTPFSPIQNAEIGLPEFEIPSVDPLIENPQTSPPPKPGFDYASVDLNLGAEPEAAVETLTDIPAEEATPAEPEEVTTKLDLAQAYLEMGDSDGARELLNEVLAEGGPTQKAQAEKLIASLGS